MNPEEQRSFLVRPEDEDERLDTFLATRDPESSRSYYARLSQGGHVSVDGRLRKPSFRLSAGSTVVVSYPPPEPSEIEPEAIPIPVIFEDDYFLIVDKPPGMVVHPAAGHRSGTLVNALLAREADIAEVGESTRPGIVHRLDKGTSGLLVVAKDERAHRALAGQFLSRSVWKEYRALVWGHPDPPRGVIDSPIGRHPRDRKKMAVVTGGGREAVTKYKVLDLYGSIGYIGLKLETGRTHQIRVHLQARGWPVLGDPIYGGRKGRGKNLDRGESEILSFFERPALHASYLRFEHPLSKQKMEFEAPLPEDFLTALRIMGAGNQGGSCFDE